jgi:hypothetical protein
LEGHGAFLARGGAEGGATERYLCQRRLKGAAGDSRMTTIPIRQAYVPREGFFARHASAIIMVGAVLLGSASIFLYFMGDPSMCSPPSGSECLNPGLWWVDATLMASRFVTLLVGVAGGLE